MLSLHTNAATLSAQSSIGRTQSQLSTSMTRLSTGYRINSASDDAAGLQIATRLKAQTSGMAVAMRNTQNATSMMQTAEGALGEASNILVRMKDLATQAADASSNAADKTAMQSEYDALASELTNIIGNTSFGGAKLLNSKASAADVTNAQTAKTAAAGALATATADLGDSSYGKTKAYDDAQAAWTATPDDTTAGALLTAKKDFDLATEAQLKASSASTAADNYFTATDASNTGGISGKFGGALSFQIGASSSETMNLDMSADLTSMHTALTGVSARYNSYGAANSAVTSELTGGTANAVVDKLQAAIDSLGTVRSALGAATNRLDHVATNLANVSTNTEAAAGRIMDVDFATESSKMTSNQMLMQAGTAMLKQTNQMSSMVMSLLQ
jgi:flagellin